MLKDVSDSQVLSNECVLGPIGTANGYASVSATINVIKLQQGDRGGHRRHGIADQLLFCK